MCYNNVIVLEWMVIRFIYIYKVVLKLCLIIRMKKFKLLVIVLDSIFFFILGFNK